MGLFLLAAFIGIPILEIVVFIEAGDRFGLWPTLAAIVVTAVIGATLVRIQGFGVLMRTRQTLDAGILPMAEAFDGLCLLLAGAFLLTPGFITDAMGFLLLVPPFRVALRRWIGRHLAASGRIVVQTTGRPSADDPDGVVIDAEFEEVDTPPRRRGEEGGQERGQNGGFGDRRLGKRPEDERDRPPGGGPARKH